MTRLLLRIRRWRRAPRLAIVVVSLCLIGCHWAVGATVGVTVLAMGSALAFKGCLDSVSISVTDGRTGQSMCDADVFVTKEEKTRRVQPCYHVALKKGVYTITASHPDLVTQTSQVAVTREDGCEPAVHTIEFTLPPKVAVPRPGVYPVQPGIPRSPGPPPPAAVAPAPPPPSMAPPAAVPSAAPPLEPTQRPPSAAFPDEPATPPTAPPAGSGLPPVAPPQ